MHSTAGAREVFLAFLRLGLTSFGGPIAHIGYFRSEFVSRRQWIDEAGFADLVALCQFLPGPASSQISFALGLKRAGIAGGLAAFAGFTLPSAVLMIGFAFAAATFSGPLGQALIHGLKLVAVSVVAQAVLGMARALAPDRPRAALAVGAIALVTALGGSLGQLLAIAGGAAAGMALGGTAEAAPSVLPVRGRSRGLACLMLFAALLAGLPLLAAATGSQALALADAFYRSGALVFGGGHVVLPLLQAETVGRGWIDAATFLAGYGAAQAMPGPLFTFAAFLGAAVTPSPNGIAGALVALGAIFLPGLLIVAGALPSWENLRGRSLARAALDGANAAVVGLLAAALYDPVWTSAIHAPADFALATCGFAGLVVFRLPSIAIVVALAAAAMVLRLA